MPEGDPSNQYTRSVDIFAFGLLMLELVTGRPLDRTGELDWQERLAAVPDAAAQAFIARCLAPVEERPSARELLEDPFLQPPRKQPAPASSAEAELIKSKSDAVLQGSLVRRAWRGAGWRSGCHSRAGGGCCLPPLAAAATLTPALARSAPPAARPAVA